MFFCDPSTSEIEEKGHEFKGHTQLNFEFKPAQATRDPVHTLYTYIIKKNSCNKKLKKSSLSKMANCYCLSSNIRSHKTMFTWF